MRFNKQDTGRIACASLFVPLIVLALLPGRTAATRPDVSKPGGLEEADCRLLTLLDESVQQRFKDIDKGFGYRRIIKPGDTPHRFKPENPRELSAVAELRTARMEVFLYVAGRSVLAKAPPDTDPKAYSRMRIKGPGAITPTDDYNDTNYLPRPEQLLDEARAAMLAFHMTGDTYKFAVGKWKFWARPVLASEQSCIDCHSARLTHGFLPSLGGGVQEISSLSLRIGDPLGMVLYAYQSHAK